MLPGWDDPLRARPVCPAMGTPPRGPCRVVKTPAGRWWCDNHLIAFGAEVDDTGTPTADFIAEYIVGYRVWVVNLRPETGLVIDNGLRLAGHGSLPWQPGIRQEAVCPRGNHTPCANPCAGYGDGCGIYARSYQNAYDKWGTDLDRTVADGVAGQVALWGRVYEHEAGYRAQYAYPLCLYDGGSLSYPAVAALATLYGVPVESWPPST